MKKFTFRLQSVLRVRRIQEDLARARLLSANAAAHHAGAVVDARVARYYELDRPVGLQVEPEFAQTWSTLDTAAGAIDVARENHIEALAHVAERRSAWSEAQVRVAALERLADRQRAEHAIEMQREEDRVTDDLVVSRFARSEKHPVMTARRKPEGRTVINRSPEPEDRRL